MIRRGVWLGAGVAIGAGGTLWARRRLELLSRRVRSGEMTGDVVALLDRTTDSAARRVRGALEAGREGARRREDQLWQQLEVGASRTRAQPAGRGAGLQELEVRARAR